MKILDLLQEIEKKSSDVTELIINRPDSVYIEKHGEFIRLDAKFTDGDIELFCTDIAKLNAKDFSAANPILDGHLSDGSRVNIIHKNYTGASHSITIRRFSKTIKNFDTSPGIFGLNPEMIEFLRVLIKARVNIVVSGGTGVGKTTFLNLLLQEISLRERVITIEDTRELQFSLPNVVRLEARPSSGPHQGLTIRDLLRNTLRMRPDRIIVGEVRGGEAFDLLQAMNTGHEGSMTSVHSNSPGECFIRLENLFLLSGFDMPLKALRYQISSALNFIVQIKRDKQGQRVVHQITEVAGMEGEKILSQDVVMMKDGELKFTGLVPSCFSKLQKAGLPKDFFAKT